MPEPRIIVAGRITPAGCQFLAEDLNAAIGKCERWGITLPPTSRARHAALRLEQVAHDSNYGTSPNDLALTANAISLAVDLRAIAAALDPTKPGGVMGRELARALRGSSARLAATASASDILSQYWFAVLMARAGLRPRVVPTSSERTPDFLVTVGTLECAVEVKRPLSVTSAMRALDSAADQLRVFGKPGVIALDLSSCVATDPVVCHVTAEHPVRDAARTTAQSLFERLQSHVRGYARSDKFYRLTLLVVYARLCTWSPDMSEPDAWLYLQGLTFPAACSGLVEEQAQHIQRALKGSVEAIAVPGTVRQGRSGAHAV